MIASAALLSLVLAAEVAGAADVAAPAPQFDAVPASGQGDVPTNALIVVANLGFELRLVDDGGAIVPTTSTAPTSTDFVSLVRLLPTDELRPATLHRVIGVSNEEEVQELTRFTTGDGPDDDAPAAPDVEFVDGGSLAVSSDEPFGVIDLRQGGGASALASRSPVRVFGEGTVSFSVLVLDRAGNLSEPTVLEVTFPPGFPGDGGCSSTTSSATAPALAGLLLLLGRRRRTGLLVVRRGRAR